MASITLGGTTISTSGELPQPGSTAPGFTLTGTDLAEISADQLSGKTLVLNIFPSVDTGVCAASVRAFNEKAAGLDGVEVLCISADLPFAQKRFCGAEGVDNVTMASTFRHPEFLTDYGLRIEEGGMRGLCSRAVVVIGADGVVTHAEQVPDIGQEPDYDAALAAV